MLKVIQKQKKKILNKKLIYTHMIKNVYNMQYR